MLWSQLLPGDVVFPTMSFKPWVFLRSYRSGEGFTTVGMCLYTGEASAIHHARDVEFAAGVTVLRGREEILPAGG